MESMEPQLRHRRRWSSACCVVEDVCCRPPAGRRGSDEGREEWCPVDLLVIPRAGAFVRRVGRDEQLGDPTRALLFRRGEGYRVSHPVAGDDCTTLEFPRELLDDAFPRGAPASLPVSERAAARLQSLRRALHVAEAEGRSREPPDPLEIDERATALLADLAAAAPQRADARDRGDAQARAATRRLHRELADGARLLLVARFRERVTLAELARELATSPFHLARLFRRETGRSLHQQRLALRLRAALEALAGGERDLTRLALALGFSSHAHFTGRFARAFGLAPSRFRGARPPAGTK
jgi:AraC-like DNA-binding protein